MTLPTAKQAMKNNGIDCTHPNCSSCENFTEGYTTAFRAVAKELREMIHEKEEVLGIYTISIDRENIKQLISQLDGEKEAGR